MSNEQDNEERYGVNPLAVVVSEPGPQPGQSHRSSGNFNMGKPPASGRVMWVITENPNFAAIVFDVMKDKSLGIDPVIFHGLGHKSVTSFDDARALYIANPQNANGQPFTVEVWPYTDN